MSCAAPIVQTSAAHLRCSNCAATLPTAASLRGAYTANSHHPHQPVPQLYTTCATSLRALASTWNRRHRPETCAGSRPAVKKQRPGFPFELNNKGMVATDAVLRVPAHPRVFAIGDTAAAERDTSAEDTAGPFPATAQVRTLRALQLARVLAIYCSVRDAAAVSKVSDTPLFAVCNKCSDWPLSVL